MPKKPKPTTKLVSWLDKHGLELLAGFLLAFLPLYPKWPLFEALPGYIVRVRLEDFVIGFSLVILAIQVWRRQVNLRDNPLFYPIIAYLVIGFISSLSAIFITQTVPAETVHVGKLFLHWARRVEYMSLAFIFFAAVTSKKSLKRILAVFIITALFVSLYGFGQKYLSWPVYSTMNREFSKGWRLVLTEHARVSSTFGGHYDLAAFTIVALSFTAALILIAKPKNKIAFGALYLLVFATLLLTASRTSFVAYLVSITILCGLFIRTIGIKKALASWFIFMAVSVIGIRSFGTLYDRFAHLLMLDRLEAIVDEKLIARFKIKPHRSLNLDNDLSLVYTETDTPPTPAQPTPDPSAQTDANLPPDVFEEIPLSFPEASLSGIPDTSGTGFEGNTRTYSSSAYTFGLSSAIRFDALWPRALEGFKTNPLLGSGYSTLLKVHTTDFTEAESTDNDYLRALGETGLLGFLSFYGIFVYALYRAYQAFNSTNKRLPAAYLAGFIAALVGLMVNALYIDIFVASKVAYTVWALMGLTFGLIVTIKPKAKP